MKRHDPDSNRAFGELHALLKETFPDLRTARDNVFDVAAFSALVGMTEEGVYKWLRADSLPGRRARQIVELANEGRRKPVVTLEAFLPFIS